MTDSPNDPTGAAGPADPDASASAHRHPVRRLARAMVSTDSYGSVLLLILFTYLFSVTVTASWAASLVITVQIGTVWAVLHVSRARRPVRRFATVLLVISALAAIVNTDAHATKPRIRCNDENFASACVSKVLFPHVNTGSFIGTLHNWIVSTLSKARHRPRMLRK